MSGALNVRVLAEALFGADSQEPLVRTCKNVMNNKTIREIQELPASIQLKWDV